MPEPPCLHLFLTRSRKHRPPLDRGPCVQQLFGPSQGPYGTIALPLRRGFPSGPALGYVARAIRGSGLPPCNRHLHEPGPPGLPRDTHPLGLRSRHTPASTVRQHFSADTRRIEPTRGAVNCGKYVFFAEFSEVLAGTTFRKCFAPARDYVDGDVPPVGSVRRKFDRNRAERAHRQRARVLVGWIRHTCPAVVCLRSGGRSMVPRPGCRSARHQSSRTRRPRRFCRSQGTAPCRSRPPGRAVCRALLPLRPSARCGSCRPR
jgi:hypothetical protein